MWLLGADVRSSSVIWSSGWRRGLSGASLHSSPAVLGTIGRLIDGTFVALPWER